MNEKIQIREILESIIEKTGADSELIQQFLNELSSSIEEGLARDGKARIQDLGTFTLKWHNPRTGRNVQTGEAIEIPGQYKVHFQPMKSLKQAVNHKYAHLKPVILDEIVIEEKQIQATEIAQPELPLATPFIKADLPVEDKQFSASHQIPVPPEPEKTAPEPKTTPVPVRRKASNPYRRAIIGLTLLFLLLSFLVIYVYFDRFRHAQPLEPHITQKNLTEDSTQTQLAESIETPSVDNTSPLSDYQRKISNPPNSSQLKSYQINPGDNLWNLANHYYADPYWWPYIYQSNLSDLPNPDMLDIGQSLKIPPLRTNVLSPSPDEQKKLALGYFNAYLVYQKISKQQAFPFIRQAILYDSTLLSSRRYEIAATDLQKLYLMRDQLKKEYSGK
ncbi:HU family DNA-binding protein [candidate division KSB1 bacterium]|nr:HU family DNA-binding protein [candidate division KSB1 bacterium]